MGIKGNIIMFIKRGGDADGKIINVVDSEGLTEEQKQAVKKMSKEIVKKSDKSTDPSQQKNSGS